MNIELSADAVQFVEGLVASGQYKSADEAVAEGVRLLMSLPSELEPILFLPRTANDRFLRIVHAFSLFSLGRDEEDRS